MHIRKVQLISGAILAICNLSLAAEAARAELKLVPYPQKLEYQTGTFTPTKDLSWVYDKSNQELTQLAATCGQDLVQLGFSPPQDAAPAPDATAIKLTLQADEDLGQDGYRLTVDSSVAISAATVDGLFWGTRTLLQLLQGGPQSAFPQLTISDKPEFGYRGLLIDNARSFHSLDFHIENIKRMAAFKLNRYQIHFSDHESYTLPSAAFPNLPTKDRHFTLEQVQKLVAAAEQYHVMIVPEIDMPGHSGALTRGIAAFRCTDIPAEAGANKLCIGSEETYVLLEKLFTEIMEMIPGDYWHLGADEVSYKGRGCAACANRMDQEKFQSGHEMFNYFINRMHKVVKAKDRKMLVWEGFLPTLAPLVDKDIIVCPFDVKHKGIMPSDYFNAGYTVLNTAWSPLYVADGIYMTTPEIIARWSPYMFGAGRSPQPFAYWTKFKPEGYRGKIIGGQMCSWAMPEIVEEGLLFGTGPGHPNYGRPGPRVQIMAERLWTGSGTSVKSLLERTGAHYW